MQWQYWNKQLQTFPGPLCLDLAYRQTHQLLSFIPDAEGLQAGKKKQDLGVGLCKTLTSYQTNLSEAFKDQKCLSLPLILHCSVKQSL